MKRMDRLTAILIALQQKPETAQRLADKFEVTKRTILRDMQALAEMGIPLYAVSGPSGGYRLMEGFRLPPLQLDAAEALTVLFALRSLTRMSDTPFNQARWTVWDKLTSILPEQTLKQIEPTLEYLEVEVPKRNVKTPQLAALLAHTAEARPIRVLYRSENHRRWLRLRPGRIYAAHGYWYCEAYSAEHGEPRTFRVDRFEQIEVMGEADSGFGEPLGQEAKPGKSDAPGRRIVAQLTYRGALLAEQDPHIGDCVKQVSDEVWELEFVCPASEWEWAVRFFYALSMDAEVREPESLRREIHDMGARLCERYKRNTQPNAESQEEEKSSEQTSDSGGSENVSL